MIEQLGDAIVVTFARVAGRFGPKARVVADWVREQAEPPRGVRLYADDGSEYTGVVVLERSRPILMLAVRHAGASAPARQPIVPPYRAPDPRQQHYGRDGVYERRSSWDDHEDEIPFR